ncbi:hypothetical protein [Azospirillum sp. SYSU D00513]|uniref:hypothetical protein n=1 Tax=Azospirillum sp. SYSU D00513 TaxID=2812561 RepID=UPI001A97AAD3|nr:hypothetical protein [Azospirillum sp. SYSU D00513]
MRTISLCSPLSASAAVYRVASLTRSLCYVHPVRNAPKSRQEIELELSLREKRQKAS